MEKTGIVIDKKSAIHLLLPDISVMEFSRLRKNE
jgi:hypothetical protein